MKRISNLKLLMLLADYLGEIRGRKRFQKIVFLLQEKFGVDSTYRFTSYLYGPYSSQLQNDIDTLGRIQLLNEGKDGGIFVYRSTRLDRKLMKQLEQEYGRKESEKLRDILRQLNRLSTDELVNESKEIMSKTMQNRIFA